MGANVDAAQTNRVCKKAQLLNYKGTKLKRRHLAPSLTITDVAIMTQTSNRLQHIFKDSGASCSFGLFVFTQWYFLL